MPDRSAAHKAVDNNYWMRQIKAAELTDDASILVVGGDRDEFASLLDHKVNASYVDADNLDSSDVLNDVEADSLDAILVRDALWQTKNPAAFFDKAQAGLKPGGHLVIMEPGITLVSWLFYSLGRDARMNFKVDPLADDQRPPRNLARPSLLFTKLENRIAFMERFPQLHITKQRWVSMLAGPLSDIRGGYSLIPESTVKGILDVEETLSPFLARWLSFRLFIVMEKRAKS